MRTKLPLAAFCVIAVFALGMHAAAADGGGNNKVLRTDVFGNVYEGDSPFPVGKVNTNTAGPLRTDAFGNVYAGDSPFSVGKLNAGGAGTLTADPFGTIRAGDSPFPVGSTRKEDKDYAPFLRTGP